MGWILFKRALRDLKTGFTRYIALSLLIIFSLFIVISLMAAADTVIEGTKKSDLELCCEDGEFEVFVPLRDEELAKITDKGVSVEKMFFVDYALNDDQVLRAFKVRENINKISLIDGSLPSSANEAVIERRYSEVNNINIGDRIKIGDMEFTVTGIGATPDYNTMIKKITDTVVDSRYFGLIFLTPEAYEELYRSGCSLASEEYYYAYCLNGAMSESELKNLLEDNTFDIDDVDDEYFKEYWHRMTSRKDDLLEGIDDLREGAEELAEGAGELSDGINEFHDGMTELHDAVPDLTDGINALDEGAGALEKGINGYTSGVDQLQSGASELAKGAGSLASGTSDLAAGADEFAAGMNEFSSSIEAMTMSEDPYMVAVAAGLQAPVSGLNSGYSVINSGIKGVNAGASNLRDGVNKIYAGIVELNSNSSALRNGAAELHNGTSELRDGAEEFADGIDELYDGSKEIKDGAAELADGARELADGVKEFSDEANDLIDEVFDIDLSNLRLLMNSKDNPRIDSAADDVQINYSASIIFGVLLVMLFAYVISVFIVHTIDQESSVIGALYSMGLKRRTLTLSYVAVPVIVAFISGVIGTLVAVFTPAGIPAQLQDSLGYFSMPKTEILVKPFVLIYGLVIPPLTAFIVNVLVVRNRLVRTPLSLLHNEQKAVRGKALNIKRMKFIPMFRLRQFLREIRAGLTVIFGLFMSLLVAFMALNTSVYCTNVKNSYIDLTRYEYMYNYKYPTEEVPEGGYEAVAEGFKKEIYGYTFDVTLLGISEDNPFFDTGKLPDNDSDVILSTCVANKYNLSVGDEFTLSDDKGERLYAFRVAGICDYTASMFMFMDIDRVRDMFGEEDDYFNVVFADHELDIDVGRLYSTVSKKEIARSSGVYVEMMAPMVTTMSVASAVVFLVVMYLMVKMMIDRSALNISLVKVFGFRNREVRKMYLDGNFYIVVIGALISIPLCKAIMDYIYPRYLVSNVGVGVTAEFPPVMFIAIFAVIIALYLAINLVLTGRLKRIKPAEILKNRE